MLTKHLGAMFGDHKDQSVFWSIVHLLIPDWKYQIVSVMNIQTNKGHMGGKGTRGQRGTRAQRGEGVRGQGDT